MGEGRFGGLRVRFDSKVKLEFHGACVSSDGGLLAYRELDEALGLTVMADKCLKIFALEATYSTGWSPCLGSRSMGAWRVTKT